MDLDDNNTINKLTVLYVFDKMGIPMLQNTVLDLCSNSNNWVNYMESIESLRQLLGADFLYKTTHDHSEYYCITPAGRACLENFYTHIPASLRNEISEYIKNNRIKFKRSQEYFRAYYKNDDGTYTVQLKIVDPMRTNLEIKLNVANRTTAKAVANKWSENAAEVFYSLHEKLVE